MDRPTGISVPDITIDRPMMSAPEIAHPIHKKIPAAPSHSAPLLPDPAALLPPESAPSFVSTKTAHTEPVRG
eukprot:1348829-Rhodomonas_salina.1